MGHRAHGRLAAAVVALLLVAASDARLRTASRQAGRPWLRAKANSLAGGANPVPMCAKRCGLAFWRRHQFQYNGAISQEFHRYSGAPARNFWTVSDPFRRTGSWYGRNPGVFLAENVFTRRRRPWTIGGLRIRARGHTSSSPSYFRIFERKVFRGETNLKDQGYEDLSMGMITAKKAVKYGYFEVYSKIARTQLVSTFWMSNLDRSFWSEIDVYENSHVSSDESQYGSNMQIRSVPNAHWHPTGRLEAEPERMVTARPRFYNHWEPLANKYHAYGLLWTPRRITWFFDGLPYVSIPNRYWNYPSFIRMTVECNLAWHGILPEPEALENRPQDYNVHYFRAWSVRERGGGRGRPAVRTVRSEVHDMEDVALKSGLLSARNVLRRRLRLQTAARQMDAPMGERGPQHEQAMAATDADRTIAEYFAERTDGATCEVFDQEDKLANGNPWALHHAPWKGEVFGQVVKPPNGMTWREAIEAYAKNEPKPSFWKKIYYFFSSIFD